MGWSLWAQTPAPVLEWSAFHGAGFEWITGLSFGLGGVAVAAGNSGAPQIDVVVTQLGVDGLPNGCSARLGSSGADLVRAVAVGSDGSIYVAGETDGRDFPVTPGVLGTQPEPGNAGRWGFLARLGPCGGVRYATYLPAPVRAGALAVTTDGSAILLDASGNLLRVDAEGRRVMGRRAWSGEFGALMVDPQGRPVVTGGERQPSGDYSVLG